MKLAVLGGSSPFTAGLVEAIRADADLPLPRELWLQGRDISLLDIVSRYTRERLGHRVIVRATNRLEPALDGADFVIHQIRYGGLDGRRADARLADEFELPADETLGPAGLRAALRMASRLRRVASQLRCYCPSAHVLNLTNPLSIAVALLRRDGVTGALGVCELPLATYERVCELLGRSPGEVGWSYVGLNHRGFLYGFSIDGEDCLSELLSRLGRSRIGGISRTQIAELEAVPLKYFALYTRRRRHKPVARAEFLTRLRRDLTAELTADPRHPPRCLHRRKADWYSLAVVPALRALQSPDGEVQVLNLGSEDELVVEARVKVSKNGLERVVEPEAPGPTEAWLSRFRAHERATLEAALEPTSARIEAALARDPLVPESLVPQLAARLCVSLAHEDLD